MKYKGWSVTELNGRRVKPGPSVERQSGYCVISLSATETLPCSSIFPSSVCSAGSDFQVAGLQTQSTCISVQGKKSVEQLYLQNLCQWGNILWLKGKAVWFRGWCEYVRSSEFNKTYLLCGMSDWAQSCSTSLNFISYSTFKWQHKTFCRFKKGGNFHKSFAGYWQWFWQ